MPSTISCTLAAAFTTQRIKLWVHQHRFSGMSTTVAGSNGSMMLFHVVYRGCSRWQSLQWERRSLQKRDMLLERTSTLTDPVSCQTSQRQAADSETALQATAIRQSFLAETHKTGGSV